MRRDRRATTCNRTRRCHRRRARRSLFDGKLTHRKQRVQDDERNDRRDGDRDNPRIGPAEEEIAFEEFRDGPHGILAEEDRRNEGHVHPHGTAPAGGPTRFAPSRAAPANGCGVHARYQCRRQAGRRAPSFALPLSAVDPTLDSGPLASRPNGTSLGVLTVVGPDVKLSRGVSASVDLRQGTFRESGENAPV